MTITINETRNEYTSTAGQTEFTYTFKIFDSTDLNVYQTPAGQTANDTTDLITAYSVSGVGDEAGGTVTLSTGASDGDLITIVSDIPSSRTTDYQVNGDFIPATVNDDFDRVVSLVKQTEDIAIRSLALPESQQGPKPLTLPVPDALKYLRWNAGEDGLENIDLASFGSPTTADLVTYNQGETEAIDRTVESKLQDVVSVKDFGAVGDGITDDTAAIQAAIDAVLESRLSIESPVVSGAIYLPSGKYLVSSTLYIDFDGITFYGDGKEVSVLYRTTDYGNTIEAKWNRGVFPAGTRIFNVHFHSFSVESSIQIPTSSAHILMLAGGLCSIKNISFLNGAYRCIDMIGMNNFLIENVHFSSEENFYNGYTAPSESAFIRTKANNSGATFYSSPISSGRIVNCQSLVFFGTETAFEYTYAIRAADGVWLTNCYARQSKTADFAWVPFDAYSQLTGIKMTDCWSDNSRSIGIYIEDSTGGTETIANHTISNTRVWGFNSASYGMVINSPNLRNLTIVNCNMSSFKLNGIDVRDFDGNINISDTTVFQCNKDSVAAIACVKFGTTLSDFSIKGCSLGYDDTGATGAQQFGIIVGTGCDDYVIGGNSVLGNATAGMQNNATAATNGRIFDNVGYLTENSGVANFTTGNNSVTVTHGLGSQPAAGNIVITNTNPWNGVSDLYVSNFTATTFDVNSATNATGNAFFGWQARLLR